MVKATGLVKITKIPRGEAPEEVRRAWVGLTLPCYPVAGHIPDGEMTLTGQPRKLSERRDCFLVPQKEAIDILAAHSPSAARWWRDHGFPRVDQSFTFGVDEGEIISGVKRQKITEVTDEMMGDPNR